MKSPANTGWAINLICWIYVSVSKKQLASKVSRLFIELSYKRPVEIAGIVKTGFKSNLLHGELRI